LGSFENCFDHLPDDERTSFLQKMLKKQEAGQKMVLHYLANKNKPGFSEKKREKISVFSQFRSFEDMLPVGVKLSE
jgi:hypothetical protein